MHATHHRTIYRIIESPGLHQFAIAEVDHLGPILRLGPFACQIEAANRLREIERLAQWRPAC